MSKERRCDICDSNISFYDYFFTTPKIKCDQRHRREDVCSRCWKLLKETIKYLRTTGEVEVKLGVYYMIEQEDRRWQAYKECMKL